MESAENNSQAELAQTQAHAAEYHKLAQQDVKEQLLSTAKWFYIIAALSVINTFLTIYSKEMAFSFGLGITQIVDGVILELFGEYNAIGWIVNILITGVFVLLGYLFTKGHTWALIVGMIFYALDGAIFVAFQVWVPLAIHLFVLYKLYTGFEKLKDARKVMEETDSRL
jgi:cation transport ATPase